MMLSGGFLGGLAALVGVGLLVWFFMNLVGALIVGALARWILPGADRVGWPTTILVGFLGGIVGNLLAWMLGMAHRGPFMRFLASVVGAMLLLLAHRVWSGTRAKSAA